MNKLPNSIDNTTLKGTIGETRKAIGFGFPANAMPCDCQSAMLSVSPLVICSPHFYCDEMVTSEHGPGLDLLALKIPRRTFPIGRILICGRVGPYPATRNCLLSMALSSVLREAIPKKPAIPPPFLRAQITQLVYIPG